MLGLFDSLSSVVSVLSLGAEPITCGDQTPYCGALFDARGFALTCTSHEAPRTEGGCTGFSSLGLPDDMGPCVCPTCGDGVKEPSESCDDGALNGSPGLCNEACTGLVPDCGNGRIEGPEQCDAGALNGRPDASCGASCALECDPIRNRRLIRSRDGATWFVTSNGVEDTYNIQCALELAAPLADATVVLGGPTFHVRNGVGIRGFDGTLRGGEGGTTVLATGLGRPDNEFSIFYFDGLGGTTGAKVADLTVHVPDGGRFQAPTTSANQSFAGAAFYFFESSGAALSNVVVSSDNLRYQDFQSPLRHLDRAVVSESCYDAFEVRDSRFTRVVRTIQSTQRTVVPAERRCSFALVGNVFEDVRNTFYFYGVNGFSTEPANADFVVQHNRFERTGGSWTPLRGGDASLVVSENLFVDTDGNGDVYAQGLSGSLLVSDNRHVGGRYGAGAVALIEVSSAVVRHNVFEDLDFEYAAPAVLVDGSSGSLIEDNDYRRSGNTGWVAEDLAERLYAVAPVVLVDNSFGSTAGTVVRERLLPLPLGGGSPVCRMIHVVGDEAEVARWSRCR